MAVARVESIDAIKEFRIYLTKFQEMASRALSDAESDVNRTMRWLEGEILTFWNNAIRKRQEALAKAEEALRFKRLYKDASGSTPSVVEEMKAVKIAKDRLNEAQEKLKAVKHWTRELQKQSTLYRGAVARFSNDVAAGVPAAIAHLGALLEKLEEYMGVEAVGVAEPEAAGAGAGAGEREEGDASMARAAEEMEGEEAPKIDPAALRSTVPTADAIAGIKAGENGAIELACGQVNSDQAAAVGKLGGDGEPGNDGRIIVSSEIGGKSRIFLTRIEGAAAAWYLGPVDGKAGGGYNAATVSDLRNRRPDLAGLLRLPAGYLAVIGPGGIEAVFDVGNESALKSE
jgi:hypothetical protein